MRQKPRISRARQVRVSTRRAHSRPRVGHRRSTDPIWLTTSTSRQTNKQTKPNQAKKTKTRRQINKQTSTECESSTREEDAGPATAGMRHDRYGYKRERASGRDESSGRRAERMRKKGPSEGRVQRRVGGIRQDGKKNERRKRGDIDKAKTGHWARVPQEFLGNSSWCWWLPGR